MREPAAVAHQRDPRGATFSCYPLNVSLLELILG